MDTKEFLNYLKQNCSPQIKTMRNKFQAQKLLFLLDNDFANGNESLLKKKISKLYNEHKVPSSSRGRDF